LQRDRTKGQGRVKRGQGKAKERGPGWDNTGGVAREGDLKRGPVGGGANPLKNSHTRTKRTGEGKLYEKKSKNGSIGESRGLIKYDRLGPRSMERGMLRGDRTSLHCRGEK